jgi:ATP synthase protein I
MTRPESPRGSQEPSSKQPVPKLLSLKWQRSAQPGEPPTASESDGWRMVSYMIGGMVVYGGVGWLIGRWTGLPVLFPIGMIVGIAASVALIIFRVTRS